MSNLLIDHINNVGIGETWKAILNLVDYLVVAFLIFISFTNILKIQIDTYAVKKTIPSLVLGVVLANLSWYICIMIVDFATLLVEWERQHMVINMLKGTTSADYIDQYFSDGLAGASSHKGGFLSLMFTAIFKPLLDANDNNGLLNLMLIIGGVAGAGVTGGVSLLLTAGALPGIFQTLFGALLMLIMLLLLLFTYFMFIIRLIVIDMLIIASPLAFLCIGFPMTQKFFQQWWSQFARWVFMAPLAFFMWSLGIVIALTMENKWGGGGGNIVTGIIKYVMLGACLYFAIKLPFTLGGGVMNAWGGFGAKLGKGLGLAANKKIGDWSQRQKWSGGNRIDFGTIIGVGQHFKKQQEDAWVESTGVGQKVGAGIAGLPGRIKAQGGNILETIKDGGVLGREFKAEAAQSSIDNVMKKVESSTNNGAYDPDQVKRYLKTSLEGRGNLDEDKKFMAIAGIMGVDIGDLQEKFMKTHGVNSGNLAFIKACAAKSKQSVNNPNFKSTAVPWVMEYTLDSKGNVQQANLEKAIDDTANQMHNSNSQLRGSVAQSAFANISKESNPEKWTSQQQASFLLLKQLNSEGDHRGYDHNEFNKILSKVMGSNSPVVNQLTQDKFRSFEDIDINNTPAVKAAIQGEIDITLDPKVTIGDAKKISAAHFLNWLRNHRQDVLTKAGISDSKMQEALSQIKISPIMAITPKLNIVPNAKLAEVAKIRGINDSDIIKKLNDIDALPNELDLEDEIQLNKAIEVHEKHGELEGHLEKVFAGHDKSIKDIFKTSGDLRDVNIRQEIDKQRASLTTAGMNHSNIEEHINSLEKIQSSMQKIDSTRDRVKQYKTSKDNVKKFMEGGSSTPPPGPDANTGGGGI
ncbi:MAG: hypothetical protein ACD_58C00132G0010 [uncultured bacterium]|nr:MAG: hypothetical protein ACD_58C00132G0010 [uncultured bacterium]